MRAESMPTKEASGCSLDPQFTPGPWKAIHEPGHSSDSLTDNGGYRIDAPDDNVTQLAFVWVLNHRVPIGGQPQSTGPLFGDVRAGANAHLIAAAPEMHDAIEQALDDMADSHCVCEATKQMLKDALAKARR